MLMKNKFKSEKGVMTVYVAIAVITFTLILTTLFSLAVATRKSQIKTLIKIKEVYEKDNRKIAEIYKNRSKNQITTLNIGDDVTYVPSGTYSWDSSYSTSDQTEIITLSSANGQNFAISSWKIFNINQETGTIDLISANPTSGTVRFQGAQGYNNAVHLLDLACNNLYGNANERINARSIKIEDIQRKMNDDALIEIDGAYNYQNENTKYNTQIASMGYTTENSYYPDIYTQEKMSAIDQTSGNITGIEKSNSPTEGLIQRDINSVTIGYNQASSYIRPYQTYWTKDAIFMQSAFKENGTGTGNVNYNLIINNMSYWIASRCINTYSNNCKFIISNVNEAKIDGTSMITSNQEVSENNLSIRPIITLNYELLTKNVNGTYTVSI